MRNHVLRILFKCFLLLSLSNLSLADSEISDPLEGMNRKVFTFNETVDKYFLKPIAKGYKWLAPDPVEYMVGNFFSNLGDFTVFSNDLLQLDFKQSGNDGGRFLINSTLGFGGLLDVASSMGLEKHREDFGLTLAHWGVSAGPYLVLPFIGSTTVRDGVGKGVDVAFINILPNQINDNQTNYALAATNAVNIRSKFLNAEGMFSGDKYLFVRDAFMSRRNALIDGPSVDDGFGDGEFEEEW